MTPLLVQRGRLHPEIALNTKTFNKTLFAACAASSLALPLWADDAATALDPIIVTATRTPTLVSDLNAAVTVINREQLALLQASDVGEALTQVAGVDVIRSGGPGQSPLSVFIRGSESNHTLVLVDGDGQRLERRFEVLAKEQASP